MISRFFSKPTSWIHWTWPSQWLLASFRTAHGISSRRLYFSEPRIAAVNISLIYQVFIYFEKVISSGEPLRDITPSKSLSKFIVLAFPITAPFDERCAKARFLGRDISGC